MSKKTPLSLFIRQAQLFPLASPFLPSVDKVEKDFSYANGTMIGTLESGGDIGLPKTGQTSSQRSGDDGDHQAGLPVSGDRWTDNGDGTVTDNTTGLMYINDFSLVGGDFYSGGIQQALNWNDAIDACNDLTFAGFSDWRLANLFELFVLTDFGYSYPFFNSDVFTMANNDRYWSSNTQVGNNSKALCCFWAYALIMDSQSKTDINYAMPVRNI